MDRSKRLRKIRSPWACLAWVPHGVLISTGLALGPFGLMPLGVGLLLVVLVPRRLWTARAAAGGLLLGTGAVAMAFGISTLGDPPNAGGDDALRTLGFGVLCVLTALVLAAYSGTNLSLQQDSSDAASESGGRPPTA